MRATIGITVIEALQLDDASMCQSYADGIVWEMKGISGRSRSLVEVRGSREAIAALAKDCERWAGQGSEWDTRYAAACKRGAKALRKALDRKVLVAHTDEDGAWYRCAGEGDCWTNNKREATRYLPGAAAAIVASLKTERRYFSLRVVEG